ncbi:uncharacterized protein BX663DRAFT_565308 [Cokeromyces recurvatus]|uniref:uncharacterized protein n=1 Tax=Cokeromyces recurvatus TaxID=90255 RepID=UPI00221F9B27|nr:uncharacterized protein BX663DRAFT_565308 [Cokeromyces recurvatus]KAI7897641.1 hypothetical protein BX663DRAFT_565308 [Cokeromyces recurvatus]
MALPANNQNSTFQGLPSFLHRRKTWVQVISGGSSAASSSSASPLRRSPSHLPGNGSGTSMPRADSPPHIDHFSNKVIRPFLTGCHELDHFCSGKLHLWGVSDKTRKGCSRLFAEIAVSPKLYQKLKVEPNFSLPSFPAPFAAYPSLSPSTKIVKVSLSGLPFQYGRESGGLDELFADMAFVLIAKS